MTTAALKASLRRLAAARVLSLAGGVRVRYDERICRAIRELEEYRGAGQLLVYQAMSDEPSLRPLITSAAAEGKRLFLPCVEVDRTISYRSWSPGETLVRSTVGTAEPVRGEAPREVASLTLIPGRAFDGAGGRVGRGYGYFDCAIDALSPLGPTVGIAYACQLLASVPVEEHDRRVDLVVTERGVTDIRSPSGLEDGQA